jgi:hypothetical protein
MKKQWQTDFAPVFTGPIMGVKASSSQSNLDILFTKHGEWLMSLFLRHYICFVYGR